MDPEFWGAPFWRLMHVLVRDHYDPNDTPHLINILGKDLLPCSKCRRHFKVRLKRRKVPSRRNSPRILQRWLIGLHNEVNAEKRKPVLSEVKAFNEVANMRSVACHVPFVLNAIRVNIDGTRRYETKHKKKADGMEKCFEVFTKLLHATLRKSCARMWKGSKCWSWIAQESSLPLPQIRTELLAEMKLKRRPSPPRPPRRRRQGQSRTS